MYKYLTSHKFCKMLSLSLALSLSSVCAAEESLAQTEIAEPAATAEAEMPTHYSLNLDAGSFRPETVEQSGLPLSFRLSENILYTAYPVSMDTETMDIYIPEAYFHKRSVNGFTAKTAPVFMPLTLAANRDTVSEGSENKALIFQALEHGYVVAIPHGLAIQTAENERLGKAPLYLLEAKAAIRYLRRNHHRLPAGDLSRIVVSGQGLGGALALQLAASCNQEEYHPYLRGLGAAERSDHIFAAQAWDPELDKVQAADTYGWLLPDGRPDPYAVSRYLPLVDLKATLKRSTASPNLDTTLSEPLDSEEEIVETMDGTLKEREVSASTDVLKNKENTVLQPDAPKEPPKAYQFTYNTQEYSDYLAKKEACEEAKKAYRQFCLDHLPLSQNAEYLRLCSSSESSAENARDLKTSFEETGTKAEVPTSNEQDIQALFTWIDATDAEQDNVDAEFNKLKKKQLEKLSRAELLKNRAFAKAQKKQEALKRQEARKAM